MYYPAPGSGGVLRGLGLDIGNEFLAVAQCTLGSVAAGEIAQREKSQRAKFLVGDYLGEEGVTVVIGHVLWDRTPSAILSPSSVSDSSPTWRTTAVRRPRREWWSDNSQPLHPRGLHY